MWTRCSSCILSLKRIGRMPRRYMCASTDLAAQVSSWLGISSELSFVIYMNGKNIPAKERMGTWIAAESASALLSHNAHLVWAKFFHRTGGQSHNSWIPIRFYKGYVKISGKESEAGQMILCPLDTFHMFVGLCLPISALSRWPVASEPFWAVRVIWSHHLE